MQQIKDRKKATTVEAYKKQLNTSKRCGLKPKLQKLDNEASQLLLETCAATHAPQELGQTSNSNL